MERDNDIDKPLINKQDGDSPRADDSRRRLAKAALASPILATLASRPVWGTTCSISGLQSGNISNTGNTQCEGSGCTPGYWKENPQSWLINTRYDPGECKTFNNGGSCQEWNGGPGTKFSDAFGTGPSDSMMDILLKTEASAATTPGGFNTRLNHFVAALLNADAAPNTYGATAQQVIDAVADALNGTLTDDSGNPLTIDDLFDVLVQMNEAGGGNHCIFNAHGYCKDNEVSNGTECIPACGKGQAFDYCAGDCVAEADVKVSLQELVDGTKDPSDPNICL